MNAEQRLAGCPHEPAIGGLVEHHRLVLRVPRVRPSQEKFTHGIHLAQRLLERQHGELEQSSLKFRYLFIKTTYERSATRQLHDSLIYVL